jgi:hypothetical protein
LIELPQIMVAAAVKPEVQALNLYATAHFAFEPCGHPKLAQVFCLNCLNFREEQKGDHHENVGKNSAHAFARQVVIASDS